MHLFSFPISPLREVRASIWIPYGISLIPSLQLIWNDSDVELRIKFWTRALTVEIGWRY